MRSYVCNVALPACQQSTSRLAVFFKKTDVTGTGAFETGQIPPRSEAIWQRHVAG
jgi:hypothetical protein